MKGVFGRLALVAAGGGCLALLVFVGLPWLTEAPPPEAVLVSGNEGAGVEHELEAGGGPERSRVVGVTNSGEEVAVVFPVAEEAVLEEEREVPPDAGEILPPVLSPVVSGDGRASEAGGGAPADAMESLPPILSPEEVAAAVEGLEGGPDADTAEAQETFDESKRPDGAVRPRDAHGERADEGLPPDSATRDVQQMLEALGYTPGPVDGIWGARTDAAWRRLAHDAAMRCDATKLAGAEPELAMEPESAAQPSVPESPSPSGASGEPGGGGARQAGGPHPPAGLPLREAGQPVVVPGSLRGVMGYRMPLVSRQGVPDQVVSGVLIPAHTTFVILKPGYWELVGLEPGEVERLREPGKAEPRVEEPARRGWNPLRLFRKRTAPATGEP